MKRKFAATIGNFDGIHLGHQVLISNLIEAAKKNNLDTKVITFNPYPFEFFQWSKKRILSEFDKKNILGNLKVDVLQSIGFNEKFRSQTAEEFFLNYLVNEDVQYLIVGKDFKFGKTVWVI